MKKIISILLTMLLIWCPTLTAAAAETATAATLRLEKTEGTVKVANAAGKSVKLSDGMRLYSGYTISTQKNSYAYVSLDSNKAVKLDASSKCQVQKSGNKLELKVISGKLFFNVSAPVKNNESLNIRTSTIVTGVRGTSGWAEVTNRFTSRVNLLEGTLTVTSAEPATGQMRQAVITSGQTATATLQSSLDPGRQMTLTVSALEERKVPGFAAVEVEKDPALQRRIKEKSSLSVLKIIGDAAGHLAAEQQTAEEESKKLEENLNKSIEIVEKKTEPVFKTPTGGGGGGTVTPPEPETPLEPVITETTLDDPTAAELQKALVDFEIVNVKKATEVNLNNASYEVGSGKTLNLKSGTMSVTSGQTFTVDGTMNVAGGSAFINYDDTTINGEMNIAENGSLSNGNNGEIIINGTMNVAGSATNSGILSVLSSNSLHVKGTLTNYGTIKVGNKERAGFLDVTGTFTQDNASTIVATDSEFSIIARTTDELNRWFYTATDITLDAEDTVEFGELEFCKKLNLTIAEGTTLVLSSEVVEIVIPENVTIIVKGFLTTGEKAFIYTSGTIKVEGNGQIDNNIIIINNEEQAGDTA